VTTSAETSPSPGRDTGAPAQRDQRSQLRRALVSMALPVFFAIGFSLCFISALHAPVPHGARVAVAGPAAGTAPLRAGLARAAGPAFDVQAAPTAAAAAGEVRNQDLYGAYVPPAPGQPGATVIVSDASGLAVANAVESLFQAVAARQGAHLLVRDVRPLPAGDTAGTTLFFFFIVCTLAGVLVVAATGLAAPALRPQYRWPLFLANAVAAPVLAYLLAGLGLGAISGSAGVIVALLGMGALYAVIVTTVARGLQDILGQAAFLALLAVFVMLNVPSSGGVFAGVMLPTFWHELNRVWIGAPAFDSFRGIIYFGGQGVCTDVLKLLGWLAVGVVLLALPVVLRLRRGRQHQEIGPAGSAGHSAITRAGHMPPNRTTEPERVLLTEVPDGGWGLAGHANTNEELVAAARAQLASLVARSRPTVDRLR
jgi:hypothetical protein